MLLFLCLQDMAIGVAIATLGQKKEMMMFSLMLQMCSTSLHTYVCISEHKFKQQINLKMMIKSENKLVAYVTLMFQ